VPDDAPWTVPDARASRTVHEGDGCEVCARETAAGEPLGGWVYRDAHWSACVAEGFEVPGWVFLELRRHAEGPWGMDDAEAGSFGVALSAVAAAVRTATGAERVYVLAFGELFPHWHVVLVPRPPGAGPDEKGTRLWDRRAELVDRDAAAAMAAAIREALSL
jgi:diadenosine tetraphosphate (Ap4A) HIT family hydrolase